MEESTGKTLLDYAHSEEVEVKVTANEGSDLPELKDHFPVSKEPLVYNSAYPFVFVNKPKAQAQTTPSSEDKNSGPDTSYSPTREELLEDVEKAFSGLAKFLPTGLAKQPTVKNFRNNDSVLFDTPPKDRSFGLLPRGFLVLDFDVKEGTDISLNTALYKTLVPEMSMSDSFVVRSLNGGRHVYFRLPKTWRGLDLSDYDKFLPNSSQNKLKIINNLLRLADHLAPGNFFYEWYEHNAYSGNNRKANSNRLDLSVDVRSPAARNNYIIAPGAAANKKDGTIGYYTPLTSPLKMQVISESSLDNLIFSIHPDLDVDKLSSREFRPLKKPSEGHYIYMDFFKEQMQLPAVTGDSKERVLDYLKGNRQPDLPVLTIGETPQKKASSIPKKSSAPKSSPVASASVMQLPAGMTLDAIEEVRRDLPETAFSIRSFNRDKADFKDLVATGKLYKAFYKPLISKETGLESKGVLAFAKRSFDSFLDYYDSKISSGGKAPSYHSLRQAFVGANFNTDPMNLAIAMTCLGIDRDSYKNSGRISTDALWQDTVKLLGKERKKRGLDPLLITPFAHENRKKVGESIEDLSMEEIEGLLKSDLAQKAFGNSEDSEEAYERYSKLSQEVLKRDNPRRSEAFVKDFKNWLKVDTLDGYKIMLELDKAYPRSKKGKQDAMRLAAVLNGYSLVPSRSTSYKVPRSLVEEITGLTSSEADEAFRKLRRIGLIKNESKGNSKGVTPYSLNIDFMNDYESYIVRFLNYRRNTAKGVAFDRVLAHSLIENIAFDPIELVAKSHEVERSTLPLSEQSGYKGDLSRAYREAARNELELLDLITATTINRLCKDTVRAYELFTSESKARVSELSSYDKRVLEVSMLKSPVFIGRNLPFHATYGGISYEGVFELMKAAPKDLDRLSERNKGKATVFDFMRTYFKRGSLAEPSLNRVAGAEEGTLKILGTEIRGYSTYARIFETDRKKERSGRLEVAGRSVSHLTEKQHFMKLTHSLSGEFRDYLGMTARDSYNATKGIEFLQEQMKSFGLEKEFRTYPLISSLIIANSLEIDVRAVKNAEKRARLAEKREAERIRREALDKRAEARHQKRLAELLVTLPAKIEAMASSYAEKSLRTLFFEGHGLTYEKTEEAFQDLLSNSQEFLHDEELFFYMNFLELSSEEGLKVTKRSKALIEAVERLVPEIYRKKLEEYKAEELTAECKLSQEEINEGVTVSDKFKELLASHVEMVRSRNEFSSYYEGKRMKRDYSFTGRKEDYYRVANTFLTFVEVSKDGGSSFTEKTRVSTRVTGTRYYWFLKDAEVLEGYFIPFVDEDMNLLNEDEEPVDLVALELEDDWTELYEDSEETEENYVKDEEPEGTWWEEDDLDELI